MVADRNPGFIFSLSIITLCVTKSDFFKGESVSTSAVPQF